MQTTSCEVLEKSSEAASKSSLNKNLYRQLQSQVPYRELQNWMTMVMIVWMEDLGVVRVLTKHVLRLLNKKGVKPPVLAFGTEQV